MDPVNLNGDQLFELTRNHHTVQLPKKANDLAAASSAAGRVIEEYYLVAWLWDSYWGENRGAFLAQVKKISIELSAKDELSPHQGALKYAIQAGNLRGRPDAVAYKIVPRYLAARGAYSFEKMSSEALGLFDLLATDAMKPGRVGFELLLGVWKAWPRHIRRFDGLVKALQTDGWLQVLTADRYAKGRSHNFIVFLFNLARDSAPPEILCSVNALHGALARSMSGYKIDELFEIWWALLGFAYPVKMAPSPIKRPPLLYLLGAWAQRAPHSTQTLAQWVGSLQQALREVSTLPLVDHDCQTAPERLSAAVKATAGALKENWAVKVMPTIGLWGHYQKALLAKVDKALLPEGDLQPSSPWRVGDFEGAPFTQSRIFRNARRYWLDLPDNDELMIRALEKDVSDAQLQRLGGTLAELRRQFDADKAVAREYFHCHGRKKELDQPGP